MFSGLKMSGLSMERSRNLVYFVDSSLLAVPT